jgi:hypothetical protein
MAGLHFHTTLGRPKRSYLHSHHHTYITAILPFCTVKAFNAWFGSATGLAWGL